MQPFFHNGDKNISGYGDQYLGCDSVFAGSQKGFDAQMMFDPFKEQFDLPALLVKRGVQLRLDCKIVGQKYDVFAVLVLDDNAAQRAWIILAHVIQRQLASLVTNEIGAGPIDRMGIAGFRRIMFSKGEFKQKPIFILPVDGIVLPVHKFNARHDILGGAE